MATLFELHRSVKVIRVAVDDGRRLPDNEPYDGEVITFGIKSPSHAVHARLSEFFSQARTEAEIEAKKTGLLDNMRLHAGQWTKEQAIELILQLELGAVREEADLAPNADGAELTEEQKAAALKTLSPEELREREQEEAARRRQERRKAQLDEMEIESLITLLAELQMRLAILSQSTAKLMLAQLCAVIVSPEPPYVPMFTYDEHDINGHVNPNWIGNLQPPTMELLNDVRSEFFSNLSEQKLRAQSANPGFTRAGRSQNRARGSRGGIGKTPATFRRALSDSSPNGSGSTA